MKPVHDTCAATFDAGTPTGAAAGSAVRAAVISDAPLVRRKSWIIKTLAGLLILTAILVITYAAAATLVSGAESHTSARAHHALVLRQAATNYRRARALCQRIPAAGRDSCIAEAHAEENRARAAASTAPRSYVEALRSNTDAAIDAGDRDSIIVEPACNIVARGQASVCEIQVGPSAANALARGDTGHPDPARANVKSGKGRQLAQPAGNTEPESNRGLLQGRADSESRRREMYFLNVAASR